MKTKLVSWLMRVYPKAWRKQYGTELADMLQARPLTARVCGNVVLSAMWQHVRRVDAATIVGISLMLVTSAAIAWDIVGAPPYAWSPGQSLSEQPMLPERIELLQRPLRSEFYVLVIAGIGFWTAWRGNRSPGWAAVRVSTIASLPLVLIGLLMLFGVLDFIELYPGQTPEPFDQRGISYTFYKEPQQISGPAPIVLLLSPLLRLLGAFMWGTIGGWLGRRCADWRRRPATA